MPRAKSSGHKGPSHIARRTRPLVAATFAMTVDGKITTRTFSPVDFTSREDKLHLLRMRSLGDAVLIGRSTLAHDNVRLGLPDLKMRAEREARGQAPYPLRVIVSNEGPIDPELKIFQSDISRIVIFSTTRMPRKYQVALREKATLRLTDARTVSLVRMLQILRSEYNVRRVACEGGAELFRGLLEL
ncbi:MAG: dihydrofolate reductase family protein [Chthoniobacterales bacterium]